jgi:hypothetical protein
MKVLINSLITLILAAHLNLVSADDAVNKINTHTMGKRVDNHTQVIKEVLNFAPMTFTEVVVIAPVLEKSRVIENYIASQPLYSN